MPPRWTTEAQHNWLSEHILKFIEHQNDKSTPIFFAKLYKKWFPLWPITTPGLDEVELAAARKLRQKQIKSWFNNKQRAKGGGGAGSHGAWRLTSSPVKILAPAQAYSSYYYGTKIRPEVIRLWNESILKKDNFAYNGNEVEDEGLVPEDDGTTADIPIGFKMYVVRKMFREESQEMRDEVERRRKSDVGPVEDEIDMIRRRRRLEKMEANICSLDTTVGNLLTNIVRDTGMNVQIMLAGPVPSLGVITCYSYGQGLTVDGEDFSTYHGKFSEQVLEVFGEHAKASFTSTILAGRTLLPQTPKPTPEPPTSDSDSPPSTTSALHLGPQPKRKEKAAGRPSGATRYRKVTNNTDELENSAGFAEFGIQSSSPAMSAASLAPTPSPDFMENLVAAGWGPGNQKSILQPTALTSMASSLAPVPSSLFFGDYIAPPSVPLEMAPLPPFTALDAAGYLQFDALGCGPDLTNFSLENFETDFSVSAGSDMTSFTSFDSLAPSSPLHSSTQSLTPFIQTPAPSLSPSLQPPPFYQPPAPAPVINNITPSITPSIQTPAIQTPSIQPPALSLGPSLQPPSPVVILNSVTPAEPILTASTPSVDEPLAPKDQALTIAPIIQPPASTTPIPISTKHAVHTVSIIINNAMWPDWLSKAAKYLIPLDQSASWTNMLKAFFEHEASLGFLVGAKYALNWEDAPVEINWWQDKGRHDVSKYPYIELPEFGETVRHWWDCLQPDWRGSKWSRETPANHSWLQYKVGGPSGLFLVVMCLSWWVRSLAGSEDRTDFTTVVEDFTWVLAQFDDPPPSASISGRRGGRVSQPTTKAPTKPAPVVKTPAAKKGPKRPALEKAANSAVKKPRRR